MPIPVTIVLTQDVWDLEIYDLRGSDKPLNKEKHYTRGKEADLGSVTSDDCSPPRGNLEIRAKMSAPGQQPEEWKADENFPVVEGKNDWPLAAAPQPRDGDGNGGGGQGK